MPKADRFATSGSDQKLPFSCPNVGLRLDGRLLTMQMPSSYQHGVGRAENLQPDDRRSECASTRPECSVLASSPSVLG
jgi:hypothetical protein